MKLRNVGKWFMELSRIAKVGLVVATLFGLSVVGSASNGNSQPTTQNASNKAINKQISIEHKTVVETKEIPFEITNVDDSAISKGTTQTKVEGVNGVRTLTYDVTYENGIEKSRDVTSNQVITLPVTKVVANGTYVAPEPYCPNGTYVNTYGKTVCSPYESQSAPAGATAQCVDGTFSFSQSRSGTCSHHGGVAIWL